MTKAFLKLAVAAGFYKAGNAAFDSVKASVAEREQAVRDSEPGKRLQTVRDRATSTADQLATAKHNLEQAEARHFESLGGESEAAIQSAREEVLANQRNVQMLESEVESLRQIAADARASFGQHVDAELPKLHRDIVQAAQQRQATAVQALTEAFDNLGLWDHVKAIAESAEVLEIAGSDAHALRLACDHYGMSAMFGRKLPPNHVSLRGPEFAGMSPAELSGARVTV